MTVALVIYIPENIKVNGAVAAIVILIMQPIRQVVASVIISVRADCLKSKETPFRNFTKH